MSPTPIAPATSFVILATRYVTPFVEVPYYEIEFGADHEPNTPRRTLITRDDVLYAVACQLEGTDVRVTLTWHYGLGARRRPELDALEEVH